MKMGKRAGKLQTADVVVKETTTAHAVLNTIALLSIFVSQENDTSGNFFLLSCLRILLKRFSPA